MTIEQLKKKCNEIDDLINLNVISNKEDTFRILDGIVDVEKYYNSKFKILWILKEPYDESDGTGGNWDLRDVINVRTKIKEFTSGRKTFDPMIYVSWSILNGFPTYSDMDYIKDNDSMLEALKSVAYINVRKLPGFTKSINGNIASAYQIYKSLLLTQIDYYHLDIIIGGSTLHNFFPDLKLEKEDLISFKNLTYALKNGKIYIDAYHPSQFSFSREKYCNDIIEIVKERFPLL